MAGAGGATKSMKQLVQYMASSKNFDRILNKVEVVSAGAGRCVCQLRVDEEHTNQGGTLHGGLTASLVDTVTTLALLTTERGEPGVSVDLSVSYVRAGVRGESVLIAGSVLRAGRHLAHLGAEVTCAATGKLLATGSHTKYLK